MEGNAAPCSDSSLDPHFQLGGSVPVVPLSMPESKDEGSDLDPLALFLFREASPLRTYATLIATSQIFERFILLMITANCVVLAVYAEEGDDHPTAAALQIFFTAVFFVEMVLKAISRGFVLHRSSYLRDQWNKLDFFVVVLSAAALIPGASNYSFVRTLRLLRPLRAISGFPGMRVIVNTLARSMPLLANVASLILFILILFSVLGLHLFAGDFRNHCVLAGRTLDIDEVCDREGHGFDCGANEVCQRGGGNPYYGKESYDTVLWSAINIFRVLALDDWPRVMYQAWDAAGEWTFIYFAAVIVLGPLFALNLSLAVLASNFSTIREEEEKRTMQKISLDRQRAERLIASPRVAARQNSAGSLQPLDTAPNNSSGAGSTGPAPLGWRILQQFEALKLSCESAITRVSSELCLDPAHHPHMAAVRQASRRIVNHPMVEGFVVFCIVVNTAALGMEHRGMSDSLKRGIDLTNTIITFVFVVEMLLKLAARGIRRYVSNRFDLFDGFIVIVSLVELVFSSLTNLTGFRALRLLRVLRLVRSWSGLQRILSAVLGTISNLTYLMLILVLFLFIFSLLGMSLFRGNLDFPDFCAQQNGGGDGCIDYTARLHYESFGWAMLTTFVLVTKEGWADVMFDAMRGTNDAAALYFVAVILFQNYVLLSLFLAIVVKGFEYQRAPSKKPVLKQMLSVTSPRIFKKAISRGQASDTPRPIQSPSPTEAASQGDVIASPSSSTANTTRPHTEDLSPPQPGDVEAVASPPVAMGSDESTSKRADVGSPERKQHILDQAKEFRRNIANSLTMVQGGPKVVVRGKALGIFPEDSRARLTIAPLLRSKMFSRVVLFAIIFSTFCAAFDTVDFDAHSSRARVLQALNIIIVVLFTVELALRLIVMGAFGPFGFLSTAWHWVDVVVVLTGLVELCLMPVYGRLTLFHCLRSLRALRAIPRISSMRVVVNVLIVTLPQVVSVGVVAMLFYVVFGILGVQFFAGTFDKCVETCSVSLVGREPMCMAVGNSSALPACPEKHIYYESCLQNVTCVYREDCFTCVDSVGLQRTRVWKASQQNFDNLGEAILTLFEVSTVENWPRLLLDAVDSTEVDRQPQRDYRPVAAVYFLVFMCLGSFFLINILVGVTIDNFNRLKELKEGYAMLTEPQRQWVEKAQHIMGLQPVRRVKQPTHLVGRWAYAVVRHFLFEHAVLLAILCNVLTLAMYHYNMSNGFQRALEGFSLAFTAIFCIEAALRMLALTPKIYFTDKWNVFDFIIVAASVLGYFVPVSSVASVFRVFRVARLLRLVPRLARLRVLFDSLRRSLPPFLNIFYLLIVVFIVYAIIMVNIFNNVIYGQSLTRNANFETFPRAMATLFSISTGESWNGVMRDLSIRPGQVNSLGATCSDELGNCGSWLAFPILISFDLLSTYIILNVVIAVILHNFDSSERQRAGLTMQLLDKFVDVWAEYDPDAKGRMAVTEFHAFLTQLGAPLGFDKCATKTEKAEKLLAIHIKDDGTGNLMFTETLRALAYHAFGETLQGSKLEYKLEKAFHSRLKKHVHKGRGKNSKEEVVTGFMMKQLSAEERVHHEALIQEAREAALQNQRIHADPMDDMRNNWAAMKVLDSNTKRNLNPEVFGHVGRMVAHLQMARFSKEDINTITRAVYVHGARLDKMAVFDMFEEDGSINLQRFKSVVPLLVGEPSMSGEDIDAVFALVDEDGSGGVDCDEFERLLDALNPMLRTDLGQKLKQRHMSITSFNPALERLQTQAEEDLSRKTGLSIC